MAPPTKITAKARILIIDDDARCANGLARMLKRTGYMACTTITRPTLAVARFAELEPDIVLLDLHMEPLTGIDILKKINATREPFARPPVVILTADTTVEAKYEALAAGAAAFLAKPLDLVEVFLRIENLLTTRDLHRRCQLYSQGLERLLDRRTTELQTADLEKVIADLRETQQRVIAQERMRALATMANGIAHDLNNGLFVILGFGDLLLRDAKTFPLGSSAHDSLEKLLLAARDNATLVKRLSAFEGRSDTQQDREVVALHELIDEALSLTKPRWQVNGETSAVPIRIEKDFGRISLIYGVPAELREVLTNLIFNAVDAMPSGGRLRVKTRGEGNTVRLEISDTGTGMTEEALHKCFEPFFTTKGEGGSGLGLAMCYGIIRRHNGVITVESRVNEGTAFTICLPVSKDPSPANGRGGIKGRIPSAGRSPATIVPLPRRMTAF